MLAGPKNVLEPDSDPKNNPEVDSLYKNATKKFWTYPNPKNSSAGLKKKAPIVAEFNKNMGLYFRNQNLFFG